MREISERQLSLFIALLAHNILAMRRELAAFDGATEDDLSDEQLNTMYHLQETIEQYENTVVDLRGEYQAGLVNGVNLPSYEELTKQLSLE
ncbi:MAG TPA: hypothetical protein VLG17_23550 [Pseudomonas sp.]|uniref:hypothetical protein n=1 Tax=Pseudomonas sp. TaxID=306 RepID=UPI002BA20D78|nr:hypothetical protein [Pseudomonas sp.]HSX90963.1 hypothetical protein [Pseudomonas sp.]